MKIAPLVEHPGFVDQVAAWGFGEWGHHDPGQTLEQRRLKIAETMSVDRVPVAFVALDDSGGLVGTASLIFDDLVGDPRNPWLADVFVPPSQRGRGIATALVGAVEAKARALGYGRLYLFTTSAASLYASLGWQALEHRDYRGEPIQVMDKAL